MADRLHNRAASSLDTKTQRVERLGLASETLEIEYRRVAFRGMMMRAFILAAGLALSVIGTASATVVDTGADAQKSCRAFTEGSFHDNDEAKSAGACEGMVETAMVFSPNMPAEVRGCPPAQGSVLESAKVLLRYLDNNPDRLEEAGITVTLEAFRDAWPCRGDDPESPQPKKRAPKKSRQQQQQQQ
jgi:Rap1a immunity proteins